MWEDHPTIDDFEALFRNPVRPVQRQRCELVTRHLLAGCVSCRDLLQAAGWKESELVHRLRLSVGERAPGGGSELLHREVDYSGTFAQAERNLAAFLAPETVLPRPLEAILAELAELPEDDQADRVTQEDCAHPSVVRRLIEESHAVRYQDPRTMLRLSHLAKLAAEACSPQAAGSPERLADLRTQAWGHHGNSFRVCGELADAEIALARAQHYCEAGTGDPPLRARLLEQCASLRTFQGQFEKAIALAEEAGRIYAELGETHKLASSLVHKAIAAIYAGQTEKAVRTLNRAIPKIDPEENPHLLLAACHNLVRSYIDLGQPEQALSLYFETRDLYREFTDPMILLRAGWQEGQLLRDLGHLKAAEASLLRARQGFVESDIALEAALVSLDLASVQVRAGKVEELKRTVAETVPIFRALRVGREAIASLLQLQQAAGQEQQALELIRSLNTRLAPLSRGTANK